MFLTDFKCKINKITLEYKMYTKKPIKPNTLHGKLKYKMYTKKNIKPNTLHGKLILPGSPLISEFLQI